MDTSNNQATKAQEIAALVQKEIKSARLHRSVVIVLTGNGKGKTTSASGMLLRARGHNKRCALFQFLKAGAESGEVKMLGEVGVKVFKAPCVCWWHEPSTSDLMERIKPYLEEVKQALLSGDYDLVVLDEGTYLLRPELWGDEALIKLLEARASKTTVVITGREAPLSLCQIADTVTNMQAQKHAFEAGIAAQKGIEW